MKRRTLLGLGATLGGAAMLGTSAFSSIRAERTLRVEVVGDRSAFLQIEPCQNEEADPSEDDSQENSEGSESGISASEFVVERDGTIAIDLTEDNDNVDGEGVTEDSLWRFPNAFRITNQGTQAVHVDLRLEDEDGDIPRVEESGTVSIDGETEHIEEDDPAVVFYRGVDPNLRFDEELATDSENALHLEAGESRCIGFDVRTLGLSGDDLEGLTLLIRADAAVDQEETTPSPGAERNLVFGEPRGNSGGSESQTIRELGVTRDGFRVIDPIDNQKHIDALGPLAYPSEDGLVAPFLNGSDRIETTGDVEFDLNTDAPTPGDDPTLLAVGAFDDTPMSVLYVGTDGGIHRVSDVDGDTESAEILGDHDGFDARAVAGVGDIDDDGADELVFVAEEGDSNDIRYLTEDGDVAETGIEIGSANSIGQPAEFGTGEQAVTKVPVVDGDGAVRLIEGNEDGEFDTEFITEGGNEEAAQAPLTTTDIDGDGSLEVVYVGSTEGPGNNKEDGELRYVDIDSSQPAEEGQTVTVDEDREDVDEDENAVEGSTNTGIA